MTDRPEGRTSAIVPEVATQAEETRSRWSWTEPSVWTERMLTALEHRVRGCDWLSLALAKRVLCGAGVFLHTEAHAAGCQSARR